MYEPEPVVLYRPTPSPLAVAASEIAVTDPRNNQWLMIELLSMAGIEFRNSGAIPCPFCGDGTQPFARIELHGNGLWRFRCRAAGCDVRLHYYQLKEHLAHLAAANAAKEVPGAN